MSQHIFFLYLLILKNIFNKIRYDWARELTIAAAASVLILLFFYIFNDFINDKMAGIAGPWRFRLGQAFTAALILCFAQFTQRAWHQLMTDETAPLAFAYRLGEERLVIKRAAALALLSLLILGSLASLQVQRRFAPHWYPGAAAAAYALTSLLCYLAANFIRGHRHQPGPEQSLLSKVSGHSRLSIMIHWRLRQMLGRNRSVRFVMGLVLLQFALITIGAIWAMPLFAMVLLCMALSFCLAVPLAWQMRDDLDISWAERLWGVSHGDILRVYHRLAYGAAAIASLLVLLALSIAALVNGTWSYALVDTVKLMAIAASFPWILPSVLFQIDARRPAIPLLTVFLLGLFLGTAIFAHWLAFILVPILSHYADDAQKNRYYRA